MKKTLLSLAMCLCLAAVTLSGCKKDDKETSDKKATKTETTEDKIALEDDNAEALHKILMERVGDYALKYAKIGDYSALEIEVEKEQEVTDEDVEEAIDNLLQTYAYSFEGEVASGQTVNIDYAGSMDGELFDGGSAEGFDLAVGSGTFIPGFEDQLIGMHVGDKQTITVTFPEDYGSTDLAGKDAQFDVTINGVKLEEGKSEYTQQWIDLMLKKNSGVITDASLDGFKAEYRKLMEKSAADERETNVKNALANKLVEMVELKDVPDEQKKYFKDMYTNYLESYAQQYSMTAEDYMEQMGITEKDVDQTADDQMKYEYAFILIGEKDDLIPTEEDYTSFLQDYAKQYSVSVEEFQSTYQQQYQLSLYVQVYVEKILDKLMETAVITDVEPESEDASGSAVTEESAQ